MKWLGLNLVLAIHEAQIAEHGGASGVRDMGLLESGLARAKNAAAYSDIDVPQLAAIYALGVIKNHPFVDGNKRTGAVLLEVFLVDHGYNLDVSDPEMIATVVDVAAGKLSGEAFVAWVRHRARLIEK